MFAISRYKSQSHVTFLWLFLITNFFLPTNVVLYRLNIKEKGKGFKTASVEATEEGSGGGGMSHSKFTLVFCLLLDCPPIFQWRISFRPNKFRFPAVFVNRSGSCLCFRLLTYTAICYQTTV
jgi:hypothetical protein